MTSQADRTSSLSERMAAAARDLQNQHDPWQTFDSAVRLAVENVAGCEAAGVAVVHAHRRIDTRGATDSMVVTGDRLQYETGEGPCLDAIWEERTVCSPRLSHDSRWPVWGPRVHEETGAESVLAFQLFTTEDTLGALNLYSRRRNAFDETDREDGLALAAHIAIAVAAAQQVGNLNAALDTRTVVAQAVGMLMERYGVDATRAFAVLTRISQTEQVKLRHVATEVVTGRRPEQPGPT